MNNCRIPACKHTAAPHSDFCLSHDTRALWQIMAALDIQTPAPIAPPVKLHDGIMAKIREGAGK